MSSLEFRLLNTALDMTYKALFPKKYRVLFHCAEGRHQRCDGEVEDERTGITYVCQCECHSGGIV